MFVFVFVLNFFVVVVVFSDCVVVVFLEGFLFFF